MKDGYVEYRVLFGKRFRWVRRYELVWAHYKNEKRRFDWHIHHKGIEKIDDRPSNLEQMTKGEHAGLHGRIYSKKGVGGSRRNLGKQHSDETKNKMSISAMGNNNMPSKRDDDWKNRISSSNKRNVSRSPNFDIYKIIKLFIEDNMTLYGIGKLLGTCKGIIHNRVNWFIEDNFKTKFDYKKLRVVLKGKDLSKYIYYSPDNRIDNTEEYKIINERICKGKTIKYVIDSLNISEERCTDIINKFLIVNNLSGSMYLKDIRQVIRVQGLIKMIKKVVNS